MILNVNIFETLQIYSLIPKDQKKNIICTMDDVRGDFLRPPLFYKTFFSLKRGSVMYDSYLLKDVHSVLVNFPREYAQESMMLYI